MGVMYEPIRIAPLKPTPSPVVLANIGAVITAIFGFASMIIVGLVYELLNDPINTRAYSLRVLGAAAVIWTVLYIVDATLTRRGAQRTQSQQAMLRERIDPQD